MRARIVDLRRGAGSLLLVAALPSLLVTTSGCDPRRRHDALAFVVDGVPPYEEWLNPKPPPPRPRRTKREKPKENAPPPKVAVRADLPMGTAGFPETWDALVEALPKDTNGDVDWGRAITDGLIAPRNTIPPDPPADQNVLPLDIELGSADDPAKAVFPHEAHTRWLGCDNCHPEPYEMKTGATKMDMASITAGEGCGLCHGTVAFPSTTCPRCHPGMG